MLLDNNVQVVEANVYIKGFFFEDDELPVGLSSVSMGA